MEENIKSKINFHLEGHGKPFSSTEDYETLKRFFFIDEDSKYETEINEVIVDDEKYEIVNIKLSILKETADSHLKYGIDLPLEGNPMPYNFRVSVYVRKK